MSTSLDELLPQIHQQIAEFVAQDRLPGLAVGIVHSQELIWSAGFGKADLATGRAPDQHTLFRVASITKTFTAAAILQLRDEGKLCLDDPLQQYIPEFAQVRVRNGTLEQVTLRRLLSHHSGLVSETPLPCWDALQFPALEAVLAALPDTEVVICPDSAFKYSNLAFGLLGEVVSRVSGVPYEQYLRTQILAPLGMQSSVVDLTDELKPRLATGYYPRQFADGFDAAPYVPLNGLAACGQLHSTVEDLARWLSLQFRTSDVPRGGSQVLSGRTIAESHRPQYLEPDWSVGYCLGWRANRVGDHVFHGHGGGIYGYASYVLFSKVHKLGVICLANVWPHAGLLNMAVQLATTIIDSQALEAARGPEVPGPVPAGWQPLLGLYVAYPGIYVAVVYHEGQLRLAKTGLSEYLLHAPAILEPTGEPRTFLVRGGRGAGEQVVFQPNEHQGLSFALGGFAYRQMK